MVAWLSLSSGEASALTYPISAVGRFVYGGFRVNFGL
jgi:hypothetical protein